MKMQEGIDLMNNKPKGFRVAFKWKQGNILRSDYFPEDLLLETEWDAWDWAAKLSKVMKGTAVNFYVVTHEYLPVPGYESRRIENKSGAMAAPIDHPDYKPLENPRRYPLELANDLRICLWSEDGGSKWAVAYFVASKERYNLRFVGNRPLDIRVNWDHFRELVILGQRIADERFYSEGS